jgi:tape measure domain-containing protein
MAIELEVVSNSKQAQGDLSKLKAMAQSLRQTLAKSAAVNLKINTKDVDTADKKLRKIVSKDVNVNVKTTGTDLAKAKLEALSKQTQSVKSLKLEVGGNDEVNKLAASIGRLATVTAYTVTVFASLRASMNFSDQLTNFDSRLKNVTKTQGEFGAAFLAIRNIAVGTRQPIEAIAELYSRIARNSSKLGASQRDVAVATQNVSKLMTASGASGQAASAAIIQLGQALSSGVLQGDELRSISENAPVLLDVIAKGMKVSRDQIRLLGAEGKLTSKEVFRALVNGTEEANESFKKVGVTYSQAFDNIGNSIFLVTHALLNIGKGQGGGLASWINEQAVALAKFAENLEYNFLIARLKFHWFVYDLKSALMALPDTLKGMTAIAGRYMSELLDIKINIKPIKINDVLPGLEVAKGYITDFVKSAEAGFFWLYDRVIGHSWIPDLVMGVTSWIFKLLGVPTQTINTFVNFIDNSFKGLTGILDNLFDFNNARTGFNKLMSYVDSGINEIKKTLNSTLNTNFSVDKSSKLESFNTKDAALPVTGGASAYALSSIASSVSGIKGFVPAIGEVIALLKEPLSFALLAVGGGAATVISKAFGFVINNPLKMLGIALAGFAALNSKQFKKAFSNKGGTFYEDLKKYFDNSAFGHAVKQVLGIQDPIQYGRKNLIYSKGYELSNTGPGVAFGQQRKSQDRMPFHDVVSAIPPQMQLPAIAAAVTVAVGAIFAKFGFGTLGSTLSALFTTVALVGTARLVPEEEIHRFMGSITYGTMRIIDSGMKMLFGGVFGEDGFGGVFDKAGLRGIASSLVESLALIGKLMLLFKSGRSFLGNAAVTAATFPTAYSKTLVDRKKLSMAEGAYNSTEATQRAAMARAERAVLEASYKTKAAQVLNTSNPSQANTAALLVALGNEKIAIDNTNKLKEQGASLQKNLDEQKAKISTLSTKLTAGKERFQQGVINTGAGIGGIFGGMAAYQIGLDIAAGMTGASEWTKVGVTLTTSMLGQFAGSGLGAIISAMTLGIAEAVVGWPLLIAGGIAIGIGLLYVFFNKPETWALLMKTFTGFVDSLTVQIDRLLGFNFFGSDTSNPALDDYKKSLEKQHDTLVEAVKNAKPGSERTQAQWRLDDINKLIESTKTVGRGDGMINDALYAITDGIDTVVSDWKEFLGIDAKHYYDAVELTGRQWDNISGGLNFIGKSLKSQAGAISDFVISPANAASSDMYTTDQLVAMIKQTESGGYKGDPNRINGPSIGKYKGTPDEFARGPYQILPSTGAQYGATISDLYDAQKSQVVATSYVSDLLKKYSGDITKTVAAYNAGPGNVSKATDSNGMLRINKLPNQTIDYLHKTLGNTLTASEYVDNTPIWVKEALSALKNILPKEWLDKVQSLFLSKKVVSPTLSYEQRVSAATTEAEALKIVQAGYAAMPELGKLGDTSGLSADAYRELGIGLDEAAKARQKMEADKTFNGKVSESTKKLWESAVGHLKTISDKIVKMVAGSEGGFNYSTAVETGLNSPNVGMDDITTTLNSGLGKLGLPAINNAISSVEEAQKIADAITVALEKIADFKLNPTLSSEAAAKAAVDAVKDGLPQKGEAYVAPLDSLGKRANKTGADVSEEFNKRLSDITGGNNLFDNEAIKHLDTGMLKDLDAKVNTYNKEFARYTAAAKSGSVEATDIKVDLEDIKENIHKSLEAMAEFSKNAVENAGRSADAIALGQSYATKFNEAVSSGFIDALHGNITPMEYFASIIKQATDETVKNFVDGMVEAIFGKGGNFFTAMVGDQKDAGFKAGTWIKELFTGKPKNTETPYPDMPLVSDPETATAPEEAIVNAVKEGAAQTTVESQANTSILQSTFKGVGDWIGKAIGNLGGIFTQAFSGLTGLFSGIGGGGSSGGLLGGIGDLFSGMGDGIGSWIGDTFGMEGIFGSISGFFMANGGHVRGAGTGKSDSIPAFLSNGEYVINAQATKKHKAMLDMINSGRAPKFADGGMVGIPMQSYDVVDKAVAAKDREQGKSKPQTQSTFNINVTGDISRQTRREIQEMIPNIALGVNHHNKETGHYR